MQRGAAEIVRSHAVLGAVAAGVIVLAGVALIRADAPTWIVALLCVALVGLLPLSVVLGRRAARRLAPVYDALDAATQREETLAAVVANLAEGIVTVAADGTVLSFNAAAERIFGRAAGQVVGRNITRLLRPADADTPGADAPADGPAALLDVGRSHVGIRKNGTEFPLEVGAAEFGVRGTRCYVALVRDATDRVQAQEALVQAAERAEAASVAKSRFLANMSHEIRTPLNGVIGLAGILVDSELGDDQIELVETINASGQALLAIVNDILDFSKIEAGMLYLELLRMRVRDVVEDVLDLHAPHAQEKGLELAGFVPREVWTPFIGDAGRIRQVLSNLVSNAVKFTEQGEVRVDVSLVETGADDARVRFEVVDTGIGIEPDAEESLFAPFTQADTSTSREYGGTGLGLAICRQLVDLMHGSIGAGSTPDGGSVFWFEVPLRLTGEDESAVFPMDLAGVRMLVVDDSATVRRVLAHQLDAWGATVSTAADEDAALAALEAAHRAQDPIRLVLLDVSLPGSSGLAVTRRIRALPEPPTVIALTTVGETVPDEATESGVYTSLPKPIRSGTLLNVVLAAIDAEFASKSRPALRAVRDLDLPNWNDKRRVLVAEDNPINQRVTLVQLRKLGLFAEAVADGLEAVEAVRRRPYDAVLMDCHMPRLDGYAATAAIRELSSELPIIAVTASALATERDRCLAAGMNDYVTKPFTVDLLAEVLVTWLGEPEAGTGRTTLRSIAVEDRSVTNGRLLDPGPLRRLRELATATGEDDLVADLLRSFRAGAKEALDDIDAAVRAGDPAALRAAAHKFKGSAGAVGAVGVANCCRILEEAGAEGRSSGLLLPVSKLRSAVADALRALPDA